MGIFTNSKTGAVSFKFVKGETVRVWEEKGARDLKGGQQTSERLGGEYDNVSTDEDLTVAETMGSQRARCIRTLDGSSIVVHMNHVFSEAAYNSGRAAAKQTPAQKVEAATKAMAKLTEELKALKAAQAKAEEETMLDEIAAEEAVEAAGDEVRDEAKALMAANG